MVEKMMIGGTNRPKDQIDEEEDRNTQTGGKEHNINTDIYQDEFTVRLETVEDTKTIENIYLRTIYHHLE